MTVAVAKKMIRDRLAEVLAWQMGSSRVAALQVKADAAAPGLESEQQSEPIPFNLDNFCTASEPFVFGFGTGNKTG